MATLALNLNRAFLRRRWNDYRTGAGTYLGFMLALLNTIVLLYGFHIVDVFPNIWLFGLAAIALYVPLATGLGAWHRRTQYRVDNTIFFEGNPAQATVLRHIIEMIEGKADPEQTQRIKDYLRTIESKKK